MTQSLTSTVEMEKLGSLTKGDYKERVKKGRRQDGRFGFDTPSRCLNVSGIMKIKKKFGREG